MIYSTTWREQYAMNSSIHLRNAFSASEPGIGMWITIAKPAVAIGCLSSGGYNFAIIDGEHGLISDPDYFGMAFTVAACNASPIIRIPIAADWTIKRALDAGAHGIMSPMCHTAADAKNVVSWSKYPPVGSRGCGPMYCAPAFRLPVMDYISQADANLIVWVQIESSEAVANSSEISAVEGIDALIIGPFDLSKSMNVTLYGTEFEASVDKVLKAAHAAGKKAGIVCMDGAEGKRRLAQGFDIVTISGDIMALSAEPKRQLAACGVDVVDVAAKGQKSVYGS